jgi:AcrR family transcriptional regulator
LGSSQIGPLQWGQTSSRLTTGPITARTQLADPHRARILSAVARSLDERGYVGTTVAQITASARVSRSRFYELFGSGDAGIAGLLDEFVALVAHELHERGVETLPWDERMRAGLWTILSCLEQQPLLARTCVVHSVRAGTEVLDRREAIIADLVAAVDDGRALPKVDPEVTAMTAEGVVGAAVRLVYARLSSDQHDSPLTDLLAEATGLILLPYLGPERTREAQQRPVPESLSVPSDLPLGGALEASSEAVDPLKGLTMRLTHRTALALEAVAQHPGASNRTVAAQAGIGDPGQASKLLARLERLGLIENEAVRDTKWELNCWTLTPTGGRIVQLFGVRAGVSRAGLVTASPAIQVEGA